MKVLVLGSGGREHAICRQIAESRRLQVLYCAPGSDGMNPPARPVGLDITNVESVARFARDNRIDLTFSGPETPLAAGIADCFAESRIPFVGPSAAAARLEASKAFTKDFLASLGIPTARYRVCQSLEDALGTLNRNEFDYPLVIKADGLAAGKGVFIAAGRDEAESALREMMVTRRFGASGDTVLLEEFLTGREVSFMVFTDGVNAVPMPPSRDHKRAFDGDQGPNTGGMGAYSHDDILTTPQRREIMEKIVHPVIRGMAGNGFPFSGILYAGLMITEDGPRVLEFNVRFGDPEAQAVLPRLNSDFLDILEAVRVGRLSEASPEWDPRPLVCLALVSGGYPGAFEKGHIIRGLEDLKRMEDVMVFHAGTRRAGGDFVTTSGRVLNVAAKAPTLPEAVARVYEAAGKVHFENMYFRTDIGKVHSV